MPELPEIEVIRRGLEPHLVNAVILYSTVRKKRLRFPVSNEIYKLNNQLILSIQRRAKYLLLELLNGWIIIHLGMTGILRILHKNIQPEKHDHIDLVMNNGKILRYTDLRRFGSWVWTRKLKMYSPLTNLGPEALSKDFNATYLKEKCIKKKVIKTWLMDSKLVAGIGNIYANESLFLSGIHPSRLSLSLSIKECEKLVEVIKTVLQNSIELGGTTIKNFLNSDGNPGYFVHKLQIYGRKGKSCKLCRSPVIVTKHSNRVTFYCNQCQK